MASRFAVGGSFTWDAVTTTHWSATSGGAGGASVPGSSDTVTFDANSGGGTVTVNFGGTITIQSLSIGAFTGTFTNAANNNNIVMTAVAGFNNNGTGTRTITLGSATYTISTTSAGTVWDTDQTNLTLSAASSTIDFSGTLAAGTVQTFAPGNSLTYGTVKVSGSRLNGGLLISGATVVIGTLNATAPASISVTSNGAMTITTLTASAQLTLIVSSGGALTVTNAPTLTGSISAPHAIINGRAPVNFGLPSIVCASGTFGGTYCAIIGIAFSGGATFSFTNSFDLGRSTGVTITAPSASSGGMGGRIFTGM